MNKFKKYIVSSISITILLPAIVVLTVVSGNIKVTSSNNHISNISSSTRLGWSKKTAIEAIKDFNLYITASDSINTDSIDDLNITVYIADKKQNKVMNIEEYLMGVVYAEMSLDYGIEALKAQAVASRSFTLFKYYNDNEGKNIHKNGACICSDYTHCQAWKDPIEIIKSYGGSEKGLELYNKVKEAVKSTKGLVMTYNGEVIKAMYFSSSGGYTESMQNVWSEDLSYLQSVPSIGEIASDYYCSYKYFTNKDFVNKFKNKYGDTFKATNENVFGTIKNINRSQSGRILTMSVGGVDFNGITVRSLLGLRYSDRLTKITYLS